MPSNPAPFAPEPPPRTSNFKGFLLLALTVAVICFCVVLFWR